jgi:hypothetical protein
LPSLSASFKQLTQPAGSSCLRRFRTPGVMHDFRNPGADPAQWLGIASPAGLDRYFEEVLALVAAGRFSEEGLRRLRLRYDTEEPDDVPPGHWAEPQ